MTQRQIQKIKDAEKISDTIRTLRELSFAQTEDVIGQYSKAADLYYRHVGHNKYLVLNHFNKKYDPFLQGFDCWISTYHSVHDIGKKRAITNDDVRLSFNFERDWHLISQYFQSAK